MAKKKPKQTKRQKKAAQKPTKAEGRQPGHTATHVAVPIPIYATVLEKLNELPRKESNALCVALENCITIAIPGNIQPGQVVPNAVMPSGGVG